MTKTNNRQADRATDICIIVVCILIFITSRFYAIDRVIGSSMEPTYHGGNILISSKHFDVSDINYDTIVVAEVEGERGLVIKRVVGMPGDTVQITDGVLYVNGKPEPEEFERMKDPGMFAEPVTLADDEYLILGDNRNNSKDSRMFGPVKADQIRNIVLLTVF